MESNGGQLEYQIRFLNDQAQSDLKKCQGYIDDLNEHAKNGGEQLDAIYEEATKRITEAFDALNAAGDQSQATIKKLTAEIENYRKVGADAFQRGDDATFRAMNEKIAQNEKLLRAERENINAIDEVTQELAKESKALDENYQKAKKQTEAQGNMRTQMRKMREELIAMEAAGQRNTKEYHDMQVQLGKLTDAYNDASAQARVFSHDNANLQGVINGLGGLAGAFSVGQGVVGMFAGETENLTKVLTKVQSIMAVTNGLQTVANTLNKDSAFRLTTLAKLQDLWSKSIKATGTALIKMGASAKAARAAAIALNSAMTLGIGAAITIAVTAITKLVGKWKEAKEAQQAFNDEVAKNASAPIAAIQRLSSELEGLDMEGKEKFVKDNAQAFEELGVAVNSVADAENLLVDNKDVFIEAQLAKAKAAAATKLAQDDAEKYIKKSMEKDEAVAKGFTVTAEMYQNWEQKAKKFVINSAEAEVVNHAKKMLEKYKVGDLAYNTTREEKKVKKLETYLENLNDKITSWYKTSDEHIANAQNLMKKAKLNTDVVTEGSVQWYQNEITKLRANLQKLTVNEKDKATQITKQIDDYQKKIDEILGNNKDKNKAPTKDENTFAVLLSNMKASYDQTQKWLSSTDKDVQKQGEEMYGKLKEQGTDYLDFLIKLRDKEWANLNEKDRATLTSAIAGETQPKENKDKTLQENQNLLKELRDQYATYSEEMAKIDTEYYAKLRVALEEGDGERIKLLTDDYENMIADVNSKFGKSVLKSSPVLSKAMQKASNQTTKSLKESLKVLEAIKKYRDGDKNALKGTGVSNEEADEIDVEQIKSVYEQLIELQEEYDKKSQYPFKNLIEGFKALDKAKKASEEGNAIEQIKNEAKAQDLFTEAAKQSATALGQVGQALSDLGDISGSSKLKDLGDTFNDVANVVSSVISGFASGGPWGAIISGVLSVVSTVASKKKQRAAEDEAMKQSLENYLSAVKKAKYELSEDYKTIFGEDKIEKAKVALEAYNKYFDEYNRLVSQGQSVGTRGRGRGTGVLPTGSAEDFRKEIEDIEITTKRYGKVRNFFRGVFGKKKNETVKLKDYFADGEGLFDENGVFNVKNAKEFLNTVTDIDKESKQLLENAINTAEAYEEAKKALDDIAADVVGNIASSVRDEIQDAVLNGGEAFGAFEKAGANAIKSLGDMLIDNLLITNWLGQYQDDIGKVIGEAAESGNWDNVISLFSEIGAKAPAAIEGTTAAVTAFYQKVEDAGMSLDSLRTANDAAREAQAKGIAQASQDSIDELNGRMTAVQGHTFNISQNSTILAQRSGEILQVLMGIRTDTARLEAMEHYLDVMNTNIGQMQSKGITIKA